MDWVFFCFFLFLFFVAEHLGENEAIVLKKERWGLHCYNVFN